MSSADEEGERVVTRFGTLFVTESRVREEGTEGMRSAFLHEVNAVGLRRFHYPWLLGIAVIGLVVALYGGPMVAPGLVVAVIAALAYAATRRVTLVVCAGNMTLTTTVAGASTNIGGGATATKGAEDFIEALEEAKLAWEAQSRR